jgi:hypothetical protein
MSPEPSCRRTDLSYTSHTLQSGDNGHPSQHNTLAAAIEFGNELLRAGYFFGSILHSSQLAGAPTS